MVPIWPSGTPEAAKLIAKKFKNNPLKAYDKICDNHNNENVIKTKKG